MSPNRLNIDYLGRKGDGVATDGGSDIYVPFTLAGEKVTVYGKGSRRELVSVDEPSPDRIEPVCSHHGACGGCQLQHAGEASYKTWKTALVTGPLKKAGIEVRADPLVTFPNATRRRAVFSATMMPDGMHFGFMEKAGGKIISIHECPVLVPQLAEQMEALCDLCASVPAGKSPVRAFVLSTRNGPDINIESERALAPDQRQILIRKSIQHDFPRLAYNGEILIETARPEIGIAGLNIVPPPGAFVQASRDAEEVMGELVATHLSGCKTVADLYCGVGTFALRLAQNSTVLAVEANKPALASLDQAWRGTAGNLKQITTEARNLEQRPVTFRELKRIGGIVFDPPRAGAELQTKQIAKSAAKRVAAVSCNPVTLARDLAILVAGGYTITRVTPIDQFKYTPHVEVVVLLERA